MNITVNRENNTENIRPIKNIRLKLKTANAGNQSNKSYTKSSQDDLYSNPSIHIPKEIIENRGKCLLTI